MMIISVAVASWQRGVGERLRDILDAQRGECPVTLEVRGAGDYAVSVSTGAYYRVRPDTALRTEVEGLLGPGSLVLARTNGAADQLGSGGEM